MIFDNNTKISIIKIAIITSMIFAFIIIMPLYIINFQVKQPFLILWFSLTIRFLFVWIIDYYLITNIDKRWILNWHRVFLTSLTLIILDYVFSFIIGDTFPVFYINKSQLFMGRYFHILFFAIITYIIFTLIITKESELRKQNEISELKYKVLESEYNLLKSQINPHFIFNALNISKALIKDRPDEAEKYIINLSEFIRASIPYNKKTAKISDEIDICNNYIELLKVRYENSFHIEIKIDSKYFNCHIPFFTLITLIENAFKHNVFTKSEPLEIKIFNELEYLFVENNLNFKKVSNSTKTGLNNLKQRAKIISGEEIEIVKDEKIFSVKLKMINQNNGLK